MHHFIAQLTGGGHAPPEPPPPNAQVEPPQQPKPEDFFTGESAFTTNKRGPEGDGYGPSVLPGAPIPPPPTGPAIGVGGAAAGIPPPLRPLPNGIGGAAPPEPPPENEATTVLFILQSNFITFGVLLGRDGKKGEATSSVFFSPSLLKMCYITSH